MLRSACKVICKLNTMNCFALLEIPRQLSGFIASLIFIVVNQPRPFRSRENRWLLDEGNASKLEFYDPVGEAHKKRQISPTMTSLS